MRTSVTKEKPRRNQSYDKYLTTKKTSQTKMPFSDKMNILAPKVAISLSDTPKNTSLHKVKPALSASLQDLLFPSGENSKPGEMEETNTSSISAISIKDDILHNQTDSEMRKIQREVDVSNVESLFDFEDTENKRDKTSMQMKQLFLMAAEKYKALQTTKDSIAEDKNKQRVHYAELASEIKQEEEKQKALLAQTADLKTQNLNMLNEVNLLKTKYEDAKKQIDIENTKMNEHYRQEFVKMDAMNFEINRSLQEFQEEKLHYEQTLEDQRLLSLELEEKNKEADTELLELIEKLKIVRQKEANRQKLFMDMKGMVGILFTQYISKITI